MSRKDEIVQGMPSALDLPSTVRSAPADRRLRGAIDAAQRALLRRQRADGHWVGELQGDTILESEYVVLLAFLGRDADDRVRRCANYIRRQQQPVGAWSCYPGGPADVSVSTKAYLALKIAGDGPDEPHMRRARQEIRNLGGPVACNSFTKFYLALVGQFPYGNCPSVPPELVLLPRWCPFNIYAMSSWTRTILVPLSIMAAHRPVRALPAERGIRELFVDPPETPQPVCRPTADRLSWTNFFLLVDRLWKRLERWSPLRRRAIRQAAAWMREHFQDSDGVGAIFPPMIYTVVALRCLGVPYDDPEFAWAMRQLEDLHIEEDDTLRLQPCVSPVWDTALSLIALADSGMPAQSEPVQWAADWLLDREIRRPGDWSRANPGVEPGGWCFEYRNGFYPDTDDTSMVLMALARSQALTDDVRRATAERAIRWLLALQNSDGGWAAFDRDVNWAVLEKVPFADHNAMLDPSCPDITARVLEALGHYGHRPGSRAVDRALAFLRRTQCEHGGWPGRWGVNYLYGTWQVLQGLRAIDFPMEDPMTRRAVDWLFRVQQPSGAWGESCASYDDPRLAGVGEPTASQTAWALLGLIAAGESGGPAVRSGIRWLLDNQDADGTWREDEFTGTGFPKVFYLKYHMYAHYFPLMALSRYADTC